MISAKEAREITAKSRTEQLRKDLRKIEASVVNCAEGGYNYVIYNGYVDEEIWKELEAAGYKVEKYPTMTNDLYSVGFRISW